MRIEHDDEGVSVYFEDGTSAKGDILVGADGIKSIGKPSPPGGMLRLGFGYMTSLLRR